MKNKVIALAVLFAGSILLANLGHAALISVEPGESIQAALNAAQPGDIVQIGRAHV